MDFLETQDSLDAFRELFRDACILRAEGRNTEAAARLQAELPHLQAMRGEHPVSESTLKSLFRHEKQRVEDAILTSKFIRNTTSSPVVSAHSTTTETQSLAVEASPAESSRKQRPSSSPDIASFLDAMLDQDRARTRPSRHG